MREKVNYAVLGRTGPGKGWQTWHHVAGRLAENANVAFVRDPVFPLGRSARTVDGIPQVVPADWPLQRFGPIRNACAVSGARRVRKALGETGGAVVAIIYPRAALDLVSALRPDLVVYHATDDYHLRESGLPNTRFQAWEARAIAMADLVASVSTPLRDRLAKTAEDVVLLPNGFDERRFDGTAQPAPEEIEGLPRPVIGFAGTVSARRLDIPRLEETVAALPEFSFVFLGHVVDEGGALGPLRSRGNVRFLPSRPIDEVPAYVGAFDVAFVPYRDSATNRAAFPLKILEALAAGRPVVYSPGHVDLRAFSPHARPGRSTDECVRLLREAVGGGFGTREDRRASVVDWTWGRVVARLEKEVGTRLARRL